ncbi:hypothetical protein [Streptomyces sp. CC208A]|uniref:hypothetical protein n=1 Tax=Streptomyces sp. CC208A TaxID=3044573 RepID=UPI0024A8C15E|nr:hypothetical protein [Streptomyces sp. CC208A]
MVSLDTFANMFVVVVVGPACLWLGATRMLRSPGPPAPVHGPVWVVRLWGVDYALAGLFLAAEAMGRMAGEGWEWPSAAMLWISTPLLLASVLISGAFWWKERRGGRTAGRGASHEEPLRP